MPPVMPSGQSTKKKKIPYVIATGFTTAFLGDERSLREFIIGDKIQKDLERKGRNSVLYLINDSYDPLNYRQLKVGVNKNERLLSRFERYCGRPISEIPDPFDCHENYSQHFAQALIKRLHSLDIYPVMIDSYHAYQKGYYADFISTTFENYNRIQELISQRFPNFSIKNLFRIQCPECLCIDATHIFQVSGRDIRFGCDRCNRSNMLHSIDEVRGKLSWKLDCAARWNLYGIDLETFSKAHMAELGSFAISRFLSQEFYGGKVPAIVRYGDVMIDKELSLKLLKILPPQIFKALFATNRHRDLKLTKAFVENFCQQYLVRPGLSYIDYIRQELPKQAIHEKNHLGSDLDSHSLNKYPPEEMIDDQSLLTYGNRFSRFYYQREYKICWPEAELISSTDQQTALQARQVILYALLVRENHKIDDQKQDSIHELIRAYLHSEKLSPQLFQYLRRILGQADGPNIATLLAILPRDYLNIIQAIIGYYAGQPGKEKWREEIDQRLAQYSSLVKN